MAAALCCCAARRTPDNCDKSSAIGSILSLAVENVAEELERLVTALVNGFPRRIRGGPPPLTGWNMLLIFRLNGSSYETTLQ